MRSYKDFPLDIKNRVFEIYPRKKQIIVDGLKYFSLKDLKNIKLNKRLSFPHKLFVAIDKA